MTQQAAESTSQQWKPYSHLFLIPDNPNWVLAREMRQLAEITTKIGIPTIDSAPDDYLRKQVAFYASHFHLLLREKKLPDHRLGLSYLHGLPQTGFSMFDRAFDRLLKIHPAIARIHVSHPQMFEFLVQKGIPIEKIFRIPVAVDASIFFRQTEESKALSRDQLGIPQTSTVIGSFQKDGRGWERGERPKLEKGPDILLRVLSRLKQQIPQLMVLLSGPARGYVIDGLAQLSIPYKYVLINDYRDMNKLYQALDLYMVTSRQEGGPKAVLESMASGIPILTTRVGQAADIVTHGKNGWIVDVEDVYGLADCAQYILDNDNTNIILCGINTALKHTYESQIGLWQNFFDGFVEK